MKAQLPVRGFWTEGPIENLSHSDRDKLQAQGCVVTNATATKIARLANKAMGATEYNVVEDSVYEAIRMLSAAGVNRISIEAENTTMRIGYSVQGLYLEEYDSSNFHATLRIQTAGHTVEIECSYKTCPLAWVPSEIAYYSDNSYSPFPRDYWKSDRRRQDWPHLD